MKTTFSRVFFPAVLILLLSLLLIGAAFQFFMGDFLQEKAMDRLKADGTTIAQLAAAYYDQQTLSSRDFLINLSIATQVSGADAIICDSTGKLVLCSEAPLGCEHLGSQLSNSSFMRQVYNQDYVECSGVIQGLYDDSRYAVAVAIRSNANRVPAGFVLVSTPQEETLSVLKRMSDIYLLVSLLVILAAFICISIYARRQSAPLKVMAKAARAFGHGELDSRVHVAKSASQEVQELALAFNNMASSLEKIEYQRKEFVANVSHELKTPMTTIGGYVDGMLDGTIPTDKQPHYLQIVSDETKRLSRLVRSMLDISRLQEQGGIPEEKKASFDICECAGRILLTFEQKIIQKALQVDVTLPDHPVITHANEDYICQVIYNLLDNAVKFCPPEGTIGLQIRQAGSKIYMAISNEGDTIPPEELPLVFDRFHKLDKSRSQNRDGWGLGLYIVKTIICSHGESISVSSANRKTIFTFTLPLVN